jgi:hypothetical protein
MAATTLTAMPSAFYAGDSLLLSISVPDFPADSGWTLTYYLGSDISFSGTADGSAHSFTLSPTTTAGYPAGTYQATARVTDGTTTQTVWSGSITILPGVAGTSFGSDRLPWYFAARDTMATVLTGKASRDVINSTIAGQQVSRLSPKEAIDFYNYLDGLCINYEQQQLAASGVTGSNMVKVRFNRP